MRSEAITFDPRDNVAISLADLGKGTKVLVTVGKTVVGLKARKAIPVGHKIALQNVKKGAWVIKHAQKIGLATTNIRKGDHVHTHNLESAEETTFRSRRRRS